MTKVCSNRPRARGSRRPAFRVILNPVLVRNKVPQSHSGFRHTKTENIPTHDAAAQFKAEIDKDI